MATRLVGLDIGTYAVRAVELAMGGGEPVLERFAQVTLPPGAVHEGEIVDAAAVTAAIRRLWSEGGIGRRRVVIGVANQRVIVRQAEFPAMSESDLQSALQFEAQELIPLPIEEAILDFQIVEDSVGAGGEARMRVLLAAAQRDMVANHLAAVEEAGLKVSAVDVGPFALVRALGSMGPAALESDVRSEAIVCVGGGVTNVVVHAHGVPRFVRILLVGGEDITAAVARELDVDVDEAEDLKRQGVAGASDPRAVRASQVVGEQLRRLVDELRGSLDYYEAQPQAVPIDRLLLTGGASLTAGLEERLRAELDRPVVPAQPLSGIRVGAVNLSEAQLARLEPVLAVPIGLGMAGEVRKGVRRISLLPREVAVVRQQRRQVVAVAAGVVAFMALLMALWAAKASQVEDERERAREAERRTAQLQQERARLGDASTIEADLAQRQAQVQAVLADDVAWTRLFNEVATVIPNDVWMTSFNATKGSPGTVTVQAQGFDHTSTARWLLRLGELKSLAGLWVQSSAKSGEGAATVVNFTSNANLSPQAVSDRAQRFASGTR
jgi:type IV pilus assembly protein PilM